MRTGLTAPQAQSFPSPPEETRTEHALMGVSLSELLELKFASQRYDARRLVLTIHDGPSTDGGRQARQNLLLIGEDSNAPNVVPNQVVGWVDLTKKQAELRSYGRATKIDPDEYDRCILEIREFLTLQGIHVRTEARRSAVVDAQRPASHDKAPNISPWASIGLAFTVGFSACYLLSLLGLVR